MLTRVAIQTKLFDTSVHLPEGLVYRPEFISESEEETLIAHCDTLPFKQSFLNGHPAKRRYLHFGWGYNHKTGAFVSGEPLPRFLNPCVRKIAKWLDIPRARIVEALLLEYTPGAAIGWHVDRERFEHIIGISFGGWCTMRWRKNIKVERDRIIKIDLEPRSAYLMQKDIRWKWQHSIPKTKNLRYSLTFRTLPGR